jgi:transcriptional antiterminator RfaH
MPPPAVDSRSATDKRWYLVYAKPRQEELAHANLERQGYEIYLPLIRQARRRLGRRVIRIEPMFPRYLFIHLDTETDNWAPIRSTFGVSKLVRFGPEPSPVPDDLVAAIRRRDDKSGVQDIALHEFKPGERVRVEEGPLMGYEGVFLARTSQERVLVLLDIVGREARTKLDISVLGPAQD